MKTMILLLGIMLSTLWMGYAQTIEETNEVEEDEVVGSKREKIDVTALPQAVKQGFEQSEYGNMNIIEAYVLSAEEAKKILDGTRDEKIIVEEPLLYELKVEKGDHSAVLYFTEKGELYNVANEEGIG